MVVSILVGEELMEVRHKLRESKCPFERIALAARVDALVMLYLMTGYSRENITWIARRQSDMANIGSGYGPFGY